MAIAKRNQEGQQKDEVVYAFIDGQNLNLGVSKSIYSKKKRIFTGWQLDFKEFRKFLRRKFGVSRAFYFIGYVQENKELYDFLKECGYDLIFKNTVADREGVAKGNVDAELVLHAAKIQYGKYDKAVIVTGDGDFYCLLEDMIGEDRLKALIIPNKRKESSLLAPYDEYKFYLESEKANLRKERRKQNPKSRTK